MKPAPDRVSEKKLNGTEKRACGVLRWYLDSASPAALRRMLGHRTGRWLLTVVDNSGVYEGGRAGKLGRTGLVVCLWVAL